MIPWTTIFSVLLLGLEWFMKRSSQKDQMRRQFFQFIEKMNRENTAVDISEESQRQLDELKKKFNVT